MYFRDKQHIYSMAASRVLVYLSRGNMQQSSTPKHMHIVCMKMLTYIPSHSKKFPKLDPAIYYG